jgi:hypothetical protein
MKNILSEISQQEKNRILEMHKKPTGKNYLSEDVTPNTVDLMKLSSDFVNMFKGKSLNFYLPGDNSLPIITQFLCDKVSFDENANTIYFDGTGKSSDLKPIGSMRLMYVCDGSNVFTVKIDKFENDFLNSTLGAFWDNYDIGIDDKWKKLLKGYVNAKTRTLNKVGKDLNQEKGKMFVNLAKNSPRPLVEGGMDKNGTDMITYIQNFLCGFNKSGKAVPKATFASTNNGTNQNVA